MRRFLIVLAAVSLPAAAAGCESSAPPLSTLTPAPAPWTPPPVGTPVTMGATGSVRVTMLVHAAPQPTAAPPGGTRQWAFTVDVANTGRAGTYRYSGIPANVLFLIDAGGHVYYPEAGTGGALASAASLGPGKSVQGTVVFTVPDGDTPAAIRYTVMEHSAALWDLPGVAT